MATCVNLEGGVVRLLVKGAPEKLSVNRMLSADGSIVEFNGDEFEEIRTSYTAKTFRTLGVAYADFTAEEWAQLEADNNGLIELEDRRKIDKDLIFVAMYGIVDPLRPGIKDAVQQHAIAGVRTIMVTGDNLETAKAIAHEAGILTDEDMMHLKNGTLGVAENICMEGKIFQNRTEGYVREKRD